LEKGRRTLIIQKKGAGGWGKKGGFISTKRKKGTLGERAIWKPYED